MSLGCCFLSALLRLGAGRIEVGTSEEAEGERLMMDNGWEGHRTSEEDNMDRGVFRMNWPCRFLKKNRFRNEDNISSDVQTHEQLCNI